ncbi:hypothetical protein Hdeb2414_s0020g00560211 [Helianthus debilis subsp. tardiflorus]
MNLYLFEIRFISGHKCLFGWNFNGQCFDIFLPFSSPLVVAVVSNTIIAVDFKLTFLSLFIICFFYIFNWQAFFWHKVGS